MTAYYNEIDPYAAQWLRNLIAAGHIAAGDVDERSIAEVDPWDLHGYTQCHFFAGIGVWSYALRLAGWPDDRPVWTGSCPCQPFSAAGKGEGTADARHLWPEWFRLIRECRPDAVFGEQVGAAIRHGWLDLVSADLEGTGYAIGAAVVGAHSVGAPHIRQRLFFVGHAASERYGRGQANGFGQPSEVLGAGHETSSELADHEAGRRGEVDSLAGRGDEGDGPQGSQRPVGGDGVGVALGDTNDAGPQGRGLHGATGGRDGAGECAAREAGVVGGVEQPTGEQMGLPGRARIARGSYWGACDWLPCIDGKARPVEPGTFPLAHGAPARVGRLRAYGNAIVAPVAAEFVKAYMGCQP